MKNDIIAKVNTVELCFVSNCHCTCQGHCIFLQKKVKEKKNNITNFPDRSFALAFFPSIIFDVKHD